MHLIFFPTLPAWCIEVAYPNMTYLRLWHMPLKAAPYICIEPWSSLPSRLNIVEDIESQPDLTKLELGRLYSNEVIIRIS